MNWYGAKIFRSNLEIWAIWHHNRYFVDSESSTRPITTFLVLFNIIESCYLLTRTTWDIIGTRSTFQPFYFYDVKFSFLKKKLKSTIWKINWAGNSYFISLFNVKLDGEHTGRMHNPFDMGQKILSPKYREPPDYANMKKSRFFKNVVE